RADAVERQARHARAEGSLPVTTLVTLLQRNHAERGDEPAIITDDRRITHAELDDESHSLAARLVAAGVGKGARVGVLLPNGIEWAVTAAAVTRLGGVLVPLSTLLRPPELGAQLALARVTDLVAVREFRGRRFGDDLETHAPGVGATTRANRRH